MNRFPWHSAIGKFLTGFLPARFLRAPNRGADGAGYLAARRRLLGGAALLGGAETLKAMGISGESFQTPGGEGHGTATDSAHRLRGNAVTLESSRLKVLFDPNTGLPMQYQFAGGTVRAQDSRTPAQAIVCALEPRSYLSIPVRADKAIHGSNFVLFRIHAGAPDAPMATVSLRYAIEEASLVLTLEDVREFPGYEWIELSIPALASVRSSDDGAWMAQGRDGGSFVKLANAKAFRYGDDEYFGRIGTELPIGMVGNAQVGCLMEVTAFMDGTETETVAANSGLEARIGVTAVHRVHGGRCYRMNDGGDPVCGNSRTPNLIVGQQSRTRLDFFPVTDQKSPWLAPALGFRKRLPKSPTNYFNDKFLYLIAGRNKIEQEPRTTFAQSRELIQDIARLTDSAPQIPLISGWVYDGQDTGYPSEDKVNSSLGTYDDLMRLMDDARRVNANVSVNVNYDDAYRSSPEFSLDYIARRPDGAIWKSRAWDGEDSYIVGMAKFVAGGWDRKRIDAAMARYRLRNAMLIDALSWFSIRNDWDPLHPASGYKNLVHGKWVILDEFRKRGIFVASEKFRYPMLGKLALTVNGPDPAPCPFGGDSIPLTAIVFRKSTIFGGSGDGSIDPARSLFWNQRAGLWYEHKTDRQSIADFYYLIVLPYNQLHSLDAVSYTADGVARTLFLEGDSEIAISTQSKTYRARLKGVSIAENGATTCPIDSDRIAFYSTRAGVLTFPLPTGWSAEKLAARKLTIGGRKPVTVKVITGEIVVETEPRVPVIVYSSASAIPADARIDSEIAQA